MNFRNNLNQLIILKQGVSSLGVPQILEDQLTLFQPGGQIMPTKWYWHPRIFRPSYYGPVKANLSSF